MTHQAEYFRKNPLISLYILILAAVTIGISVMAAVKAGTGVVLTENKNVRESSAGISPTPAAVLPPAGGNTGAIALPETGSASSSSQAPADPAGRCIVTISGNRYDVTSLRTSHPGGDVFVCGTDQTDLYRSQHGTNLNRMQRYLVDGQGNTSVSSASPPAGGKFSGDDDDEDD